MEIISRFVVDGRNCYTVTDKDIAAYDLAERALYKKDVMQALIAAGYKYKDYYGTILNPQGICIRDLMEDEKYVDEDDKLVFEIDSEAALSESEAATYFDREVVEANTIKFMEPVTVQIETREELIEFLRKCQRTFKMPAAAIDVRPLNSFVSKSALFTVSEVLTDEVARECMTIIARRRNLKNYNAYKLLIEFLQDSGVLGETYTPDDVKKAYMSWGICGINSDAIAMHEEYGACLDIGADGNANLLPIRSAGVGLLAKNGNITTLGLTEATSEHAHDDQELINMPLSVAEITSLRQSVYKWKTMYRPVGIHVKQIRNRTHIDFIEDGVIYKARVDHNMLYICDAAKRANPCREPYLSITNLNGVSVPLPDESTISFERRNLVLACVNDLIRERTKVVDVKSSYQMIINEGVTPEAAITYMAAQLDTNRTGMNPKQDISFFDAASMYRQGVPEDLALKYNPNGIETDNIDDLIDIMCNTRSQLEEMGQYLAAEDSSAMSELATRPIEQLEFVLKAKTGGLNIDWIRYGTEVDKHKSDADMIADVIIYLINEERPINEMLDYEFERALTNIERFEQQGIVSIDELVGIRDQRALGFLRDRAILNATRIQQAAQHIYVTKIYREMANVPIEQQRHFMFECILFKMDSNSKLRKLHNAIVQQLHEEIRKQTDMSESYRSIMKDMAYQIAEQLMIEIVFKTAQKTVIGGGYLFKLSPFKGIEGLEDITLSVVLDKNVVDANYSGEYAARNCTLADYCDIEMDSMNRFARYCANARITPWYVIPFDGVSIPTYNFAVNFMQPAAFASCSREYQEKLQTAKVRTIDGCTTGDAYLIDGTLPRDDADTLTEEALYEKTLDPDEYELIPEYYKRFQYFKRKADQAGETLKRVPLRNDIVYKNYADVYGMRDIPTDNEYTTREDRTLYLATTDVTNSSQNSNLLTMSTEQTYGKFNLSECQLKDVVRWHALVDGSWMPDCVVWVYSGTLHVETTKGAIERDIRHGLDTATANKLVEKGFAYRLDAGRVLVSAINGLYWIKTGEIAC